MWGDTPKYWKWTSLPESRFLEVAKLNFVCWFDVKARIGTKILSIRTNYSLTLPVDFGVYFDGSDNGEGRKVVLDPLVNMPKLSEGRGNGWMEIEMGVFFNVTGEDGTVVCSVFGFDRSKSGIIIQGVQLRPKSRR
ncbi:hypothetical protein CICLE_v10006497mg [Citrus x clementina]|uniref:Uncharacterized protein n=1 Tax=Citrus clementina TaxID=85681 RepID=V4S1E1_CITCL|nr:hypothetical protein CICLE_v10006497mg [Citrus x clementina]